MNQRRILLIILCCLGALLFGRAVLSLYRDALASRDSQIKSQKSKLEDAQFAKQEAMFNAREWMKLGAQTLSMDPNETMQRLRDDLSDLTKKSGLVKERIDLGTVQPLGKNGVRGLGGTMVTAEGSMQQVVQFLHTLYRRPYIVKVRSLGLTQASTGKDGPKDQLRMQAKLDTLILPANGKVPRITPADLSDPENERDRTQFKELAGYQALVDRKIWEKYVPPPPGKPTLPTPAHDAADLATNLTLSWTGGENTERYQIFFGEGSPSQPAGTQEGTQLARTSLKPGVRYFWRVDAIGEGGTTRGDVWSFMTRGEPPRPVTRPAVVDNSPPQPAPPPPPPDSTMVLARVLSSPASQQAVLVDQAQLANPAAPDKRVQVGEPLFGGTLVYVHPRGVISERDGALRFHGIRLQLQQAQPLTESEHPEIWQELEKLGALAAGITDRPG